MSDIVMIKRRDRYYVIAETEPGRKYLEGKHIDFDKHLSVPADVAEELITEYQNDGYLVEVR